MEEDASPVEQNACRMAMAAVSTFIYHVFFFISFPSVTSSLVLVELEVALSMAVWCFCLSTDETVW